MNEPTEVTRLKAKKMQLKILMAMMLIAVVAAPLLGPKLYPTEFSHLNSDGRRFYYIGTTTIFTLLFFFNLAMHRRADRKLHQVQLSR